MNGVQSDLTPNPQGANFKASLLVGERFSREVKSVPLPIEKGYIHTKSGLSIPFLVAIRQEAGGKEDLSPKGGYQGGFSIKHQQA